MHFKSLVAAAVMGAVAASASAALKDGTYEAKVIGHNAPMTVTVTIAGGKIASVSTKNLESFGVGKTALEVKGKEIVSRQSLGIDAMSGATLSSFALVQGVEECLKSAGATEAELDKWTAPAVKYPANPITVTGDVAVIGGGGTGLAAAVSALENGAAKVVIIEKLGYLGGSTNVSGGALNAVDDKRQKAQGIKDSIPTFFDATMKGGHNVGNPALVHYLTDNACKTVEWMEKQGVVFRDKIGAATGSLGQRSHYGVKPAGYAYTSVFENVLKTKYKDRVEFLLLFARGERLEHRPAFFGFLLPADRFKRSVDRLLHDVEKIKGPDGFFQKTHRAPLHGAHGHGNVAVTRHENHRQRAAALDKLAVHLHARHAVHAHVQKNAARAADVGIL